jgi:hypothetical protein
MHNSRFVVMRSGVVDDGEACSVRVRTTIISDRISRIETGAKSSCAVGGAMAAYDELAVCRDPAKP